MSDPYASNVVFLLKGNTLTDTSPAAATVTAYPAPTILPTTNFPGESSLSMYLGVIGGTPTYANLSAPWSTNYDFGTGDFTIESWINNSTLYGSLNFGLVSIGLTSTFESSFPAVAFTIVGKYGLILYYPGGSASVTGTVDMSAGWHHVAVSRTSGVLTFWVDGSQCGTSTTLVASLTPSLTTAGLNVGGYWQSEGSYTYLGGLIQNLRVTKGVGRYTTTFDPTSTDAYASTSGGGSGGSGSSGTSWDFFTSPNYTYPTTDTPVLSAGTTTDTTVLPVPIWDLVASNGSVTLPASFMQDLILGNATSTLHMYLKMPTLPNSVGVLISKSDDDVTTGWNLYTYGSGVYFVDINPAVNLRWNTAQGVLVPNTWTLVSMVYSGPSSGNASVSNFTMYINGVAQTLTPGTSANGTVLSDASIPLTLGYSEYGPTYGFAGSIAFACAVRSVQTATQIAAFATNPLSMLPPGSPSWSNGFDPYWNSVLLLIPGSQDLLDHSNYGWAVTNNSVVRSAESSLFGQPTMLFNGSYSYLKLAASTVWQWGSGDFTIEFHAWKDAPGSGPGASSDGSAIWDAGLQDTVITQQWGPGWNVCFYDAGATNGSAGFFYGNDSSVGANYASAYPNDSTWHHWCVSRKNGMLYLFKDGVLVATNTNPTYDTVLGTDPLTIGAYTLANVYYNGFLANIRLTKGVARYTANFTPPTGQYPTGPYLGSPVFDPANLLLWLDASDTSKLSLTGTQLNSITDKSLNARVFTAGSSAPSYDTSVFGLGAIAPNGSWLKTISPLTTATAFSAFMVVWVDNPAGISYTALLNNSQSSDASNGSDWIGIYSSPGYGNYYGAGVNAFWGNGGISQSWGTNQTFAGPSKVVLSLTFDGTGSDAVMRVNGYTWPVGSSFTSEVILDTIGASPLNTGTQGTGLIAEVIIYNRTLALSEVYEVESYLNDKWINVKVPATDPYWSDVVLLMPGTDLLDHSSYSQIVTNTNLSAIQSGTYTGAVTVSNAAPLFGNNVMLFPNGASSTTGYAYLVVSAASSLIFGTSDFTIEFHGWDISVSSAYGAGVAITNYTYSSSANAFMWFTDTLGGDYLEWYNDPTGSSNQSTAVDSTSITKNVWHHFAYSRKSGVAYMFVDGVLVASGPDTANYSAENPIQIGGGYNTSGFYGMFNGYMANIRITNGVGRYTTAFTPPIAPYPIGTSSNTPAHDLHWANVVLLMPGSDLLDHSSYANPVSQGGSDPVLVSPSLSLFDSKVMVFDGTAQNYLTIPSAPQFVIGTGDFTLEVHLAFSAPANASILGNSNYWSLVMPTPSYGTLGVYYGGWTLVDPAYPPIDSEWHHYAYSRVAGTAYIFLDGVLRASGPDTRNYEQTGTTTNFLIGHSLLTGATYTGLMANVRFTKGVGRYTTSFAPPTAPYPTSGVTIVPDPFFDHVTLLIPGADLTDYSSNSWSVTNHGVVASSTQKLFGYDAMFFNGSSSWMQLPQSYVWDWGHLDFTIEFHAWKSTAGTEDMSTGQWYSGLEDVVLSQQGTWGAGSIGPGWHTEFHAMDNGGGWRYDNDSSAGISDASCNPNDSAWHHYAITRASGRLRMFQDGVLVSSVSLPSYDTYSGGNEFNWLNIGTNLQTTPGWFNGYLANIRITKGVARYTETFLPPTEPYATVGPSVDPYWNNVTLLLTGNNLLDSSSLGNTVTQSGSGTVAVTTSQPLFGGGALSFGGSTATALTVTAPSPYGFGTNDFTVEFHLWTNTAGQYPVVGNLSTPTSGWEMYTATPGYGVFRMANSATLNVVNSAGSMPGDSAWHHYAYSRVAGVAYLFLDGVLFVSGPDTTNYSAIGSLYIGVSNYSYIGGYLDGLLANLRITTGVGRYSANFTAPTAPYPTVQAVGPNGDSAGLELWIDASNARTVTRSGTLVTAVQDQSTYGRTFVPLGTSQVNLLQDQFSLGALSFDTMASLVTPIPLDTATSFTVFMVGYFTNPSNGFAAVAMSNSVASTASNGSDWVGVLNSATSGATNFLAGAATVWGNGGTAQEYQSSTEAYSAPAKFLFASVFDGVANDGLIRVNQSNVTTYSGSGITSPIILDTLGANLAGGFSAAGEVAEVIVFGRALSLTEVESVEAYLKAKWMYVAAQSNISGNQTIADFTQHGIIQDTTAVLSAGVAPETGVVSLLPSKQTSSFMNVSTTVRK